MTELEQIAYDNGVACGFMVARGIGISPLPVEHEIFKYENWTDEMKAMLIEKPYYIMYKIKSAGYYCITFSANPFTYWLTNPYTSRYSIRFTENNMSETTFIYSSSSDTYYLNRYNLAEIYYGGGGGGFYVDGNNLPFTAFYTNGLTSVIENPYKYVNKFPLELMGANKSYYEPQNYTAIVNLNYVDAWNDVRVVSRYFTCHGGDIYSYVQSSELYKNIYFTNNYSWSSCTTSYQEGTKNGVSWNQTISYNSIPVEGYGSYGWKSYSYTCTIPIFINKETLSNYLSTEVCSLGDFDYMPSNYYIDSNGKLIKS